MRGSAQHVARQQEIQLNVALWTVFARNYLVFERVGERHGLRLVLIGEDFRHCRHFNRDLLDGSIVNRGQLKGPVRVFVAAREWAHVEAARIERERRRSEGYIEDEWLSCDDCRVYGHKKPECVRGEREVARVNLDHPVIKRDRS